MFPSSFQFSDVYLVHVWDALTSGIFGTFAFNNLRDRCRADNSARPPHLLPSAWDWPSRFSDAQISLMFDPLHTAASELDVLTTNGGGKRRRCGFSDAGDGLRLPTRLSDIRLWSLCYLRWLTPVMVVGGGRSCEYLTQCLLVEEIAQLRQKIGDLERASKGGGGGGGDKRRSVLIFGSGLAVDDSATSAGLNQHVSSSFPFVPRHSADETPSALSQVPSVDTYLESSRLSADVSGLAMLDDSTSASFCDED